MSTTPEPVEPTTAADVEKETSPAPAPPEAGAQPEAPTPAADPGERAEPPVAEGAAPAGDEPAAQAPQDTPPAPAEEPAAQAPDDIASEPAPQPPAAQAASQAPAAAEAVQGQPGDTGETAQPQPGDTGETAQPQPGEAGEAADTAPPQAGEGAEPGEGKRRKKRRKGQKGEAAQQAPAEAEDPHKKRRGPEPAEVTARIGTSNDQALAYLAAPDPKLARLSRKVTEALLPDLHPVTAAALLGPAGFTRHLVASAATGRYRDLFVLWETFRRFPAEARPELAERSIALAKAQERLQVAVRIGLTGRSDLLAEDIGRAEGLIWTWLREALMAHLPAVGARPAVASALLRREPDLDVPLPAHPDDRWLAEAAAARRDGPLADRVEAVLGANVHRLPATVDTLRLATVHYPDRVAALVDRVDLDAPDIGAFLAWARDHGAADRLHGRIRDRVAAAAARDRADGLARWYAWQQRGVHLELPEPLRTDSLEGFDLSRPETAELAARLQARGVDLDLQQQLEDMAGRNRQLAEKAYEAMVCAGLDVTLPVSLKDNPVVNPGTRCPKCQAWTWVRPGHEARCPRPEAPAPAPEPDPFDFVSAEAGTSERA